MQSSFLHIPAYLVAGVRAQGKPWFGSTWAEKVKGLAQGPKSGSLVMSRLQLMTF